jgi:hypothetical protein
MPTPVEYEKPRRINVVSVTLVLLLLLAGYAAWQWAPLYFQRHEAHRVLQATGSTIAGRAGFYERDDDAREDLRKAMQRQLVEVGIDDPKLETWIEIEGKELRLGAVYSAWIEWPLDVIERHESVYQVEHVIALP